jgi:hypothetical protein
MRHLPTDRKILEAIYQRYYGTFASFSKESPDREAKIYVPLDLESIAEELGVDTDIVFGRLYYHLEKKHGYKWDDGTNVYFFSRYIKNDRHCVNFPLLASVLAGLQAEHLRFRLATAVSIISLAVAVAALAISLFNNFWLKTDVQTRKPSPALSSPARSNN